MVGARTVTCPQEVGSQPANPDPNSAAGTTRRCGVRIGTHPAPRRRGRLHPALRDSGGAHLGDPCCARAAIVDDPRIGFFSTDAEPGPRFDSCAFIVPDGRTPDYRPAAARHAWSARGVLAFEGTSIAAATSPMELSFGGRSVS